MFFDTFQTMLMKENLQQYLFSSANVLRYNPLHKLQPIIVQVISNQIVSDGITNFQCRFKKTSKRGSIIRLIDWQLELTNFQLIIDDYQYLGGQGYAVRNGKPWDIEKLKLASNSNIISNDFIVLHCPANSKISHKNQKLQTNKNNNGVNQQKQHQAIQTVSLPTGKVKTFLPYFNLKNYQHKKMPKKTSNTNKQAIKQNNQYKEPSLNVQPNHRALTFSQNNQYKIKQIKLNNAHKESTKDDNKYQNCCNQKSNTSSEFDIRKVKKIRISSQNDPIHPNNLLIKCSQIQQKFKQEQMNGCPESGNMTPLSQMDIQWQQSQQQNPNNQPIKHTKSQIKYESQIIINSQSLSKSAYNLQSHNSQIIHHSSDSNGRQLTFNKQQILKLLGKQ